MSEPVDSLAILRRISDFLKTLSEDQMKALARGDVKLTVVPKHTKRSWRSEERENRYDIDETLARLTNMPSREEAFKYLADAAPTKRALQELVSKLDLPNRKSDTAEDLRNRIVDATIGYRLRSIAVQGETAADVRSRRT
jgi:hypothetical protein